MTRRPHLDHAMERDLAALADGSIAPAQRERVEPAVAASPELQRELAAQRYAVGVVRAAATERAPAALRFELAAATPRPRRRIRIGALAAAGAAATAAAAVLLIPGSPSQDASVADAAALATRPPVAGVTQPARDEASLASPRGAGLPFPAWQRKFGWRAVGGRRDRVDGRVATTVFYRKQTQAVAYTIVGGRSLRGTSWAHTSVRDGTRFRTFTFHGRHAVTWLRHGRTCILSGAHVTDASLVRLASWRGAGEITS